MLIDQRFPDKVIGMIQKQGNWVSYELKPRDVEKCKNELWIA